MQNVRLLVVMVCLAALAACTPPRGPSHPFEGDGRVRDRPPGEESYSQVLEMRATQGCDAALEPLRRFAGYGGGFEIAQFQLGDCLIQKARSGAANKAELVDEAVDVLLKAANSNDPNAQGVLADLYYSGDLIPRDPVTAGKWFLLYKRNNLRINLGARALVPGLEADMLRELTQAQWAEAEALAEAFTPVIQDTVEPAGPQLPERPQDGPIGPDGQIYRDSPPRR